MGQGWLGQLRDGELEVLCEDPNLILPDANNGVAVTADIVGGLFFGDSRAVFAYHPATGLEVIDRTSGRSPVGVLSLLTDREGTVWFTAYRGVSKLPGRSLVSYDRRHGLLGDEVTALLERPDGTWFLGHNDGLTILGSQPRRLRFPVQGGHYGRVMDFEIDPDGRVWIAADRLGLAWLDNDSTFVWAGPETGLRGPVSSVKCDRQGRLWVACQSGLYRRQGDRFVAALIPDSDFERGNGVRRIELAADGSLLVATARSGLFRVHGEDVRRFAAPPHSPYNSAFAALELDDGRVWVGTAAGLCSVVGDSLVATRAPDPVVDRPIYALLRDGRGDVWLGTDNGVRIWDGRTLRTLTFVEGLIGKETNRDALVADSAGRIWIGQDRGVTVYDRRLDAAPLGAPQVELAGIAVGDQILSGYDEMTVGAPISSLVVRFRGLSYRLEPLTYRTWLEPFESDWQPPRQVPRRLIRYDDVPPGSYRFHIQAIRGDGVASEVCTSGLLVIEPPVWRRPWFVILAAAVVLFVLWSLVSTLASRSAARKLEREVAERTAALQASETELRAQSGRLATILGQHFRWTAGRGRQPDRGAVQRGGGAPPGPRGAVDRGREPGRPAARAGRGGRCCRCRPGPGRVGRRSGLLPIT